MAQAYAHYHVLAAWYMVYTSIMAMSSPSWESRTYGETVLTSVAGERDSLIIASLSHLPSSDVIPRCSFEVTEEDRRRLANQGVHPDTFDDIGIIRARLCLDKTKNQLGEEISETGKELSRSYILTRLENVLSNSNKSGVVIHYFGNGKKNTGDWCFKDGFITFKDIAEVYMRVINFRGRVLTITTDCSHSGHWVKACAQFLDDQGVRPCGHSAFEKGILLKVFASCKPEEIAAAPCFSIRGSDNDKNSGSIMRRLMAELRPTQHYGYDFTQIRCVRTLEEPCALPPDYTWQKKMQTQRVFVVRGIDRGQPAWHYVLLVDDEETIDKFKRETQGEQAGKLSINLEDYGQILKSGWGRDPPNDITEWIEKKYGCI